MAGWLAGHWVLITAVHQREREELAHLVAQAGGESQTAFSVRDPPHLVITRSVRSPKYRTLLRAHPHTPVVTPEWLAASAQVRRRWLGWVCSSGRRSCCQKQLNARQQAARLAAAATLAAVAPHCATLPAAASPPPAFPTPAALHPPCRRRRAGCCRMTASGPGPSWASPSASRG